MTFDEAGANSPLFVAVLNVPSMRVQRAPAMVGGTKEPPYHGRIVEHFAVVIRRRFCHEPKQTDTT